jgi:hypothetical protein
MMEMNMDDRRHVDRTDASKSIDDSIDEFTISMPRLLYESRKRQRHQDDDDIDKRKQQGLKKSTKADAAQDATTTMLPARPVMDTMSDSTSNNSSITLLLPDDLLAHVSTFLNVGSLKTARLACRRFNRVLSSNTAGWVQHCNRLWNRKAHVLRRDFLDHGGGYRSTAAMEAYRQSCIDARLRHVIRREELIYDPTRHHGGDKKDSNHHHHHDTIWSFRFKESAGQAWTRRDPWHNHTGPARRMVFLSNGQVAQVGYEHARTGHLTADGEDGPCHGPLKLCRPFSENGGNEADNEDDSDDDEEENNDHSGLDVRWRIVSQPMDLPPRGGNHGSDPDAIAYIRLTVAGRDVPTYIVHRSPSGNWGFLMENCWGVFASFPLPCKRKNTAPALTGTANTSGALPSLLISGLPSFPQPQEFVPSERNESSASTFSAVGDATQQYIPLPQFSDRTNKNESSATDNDDVLFWLADDLLSASSEDGTNAGAGPDDDRLPRDFSSSSVHEQSSAATEMKITTTTSMDHLLDDAFLTVTNHWQWREALLYNMGSTFRFPDGPHALAEFDRICSLSPRTRGA